MSALENNLRDALHVVAPDLVHLIKEQFRFAPPRRWRSDFAFPDAKVLVEVEGIGGLSRHRTIRGYANDCEKYNAATLLGYSILRYDSTRFKSGGAARCAEEIAAFVRARIG